VKPDVRAPTARVDAANRAATREPSSAGYINAVQVYPWTEGALYRLYTAPERVSDIALQPGEKLIAVSAGDTVRWVIGDTTSGAGEEARVHVLVKPFAPGLGTNMVITTDRRAYHVALESTDATAMAAISWTYPQDRLLALQRQNVQAEAAKPIADNVAVTNLRFRYAISGDSPPWRPVRAWDDGAKVYIEFPGRLDQGEAPPLFVVGPLGDSQLVNYRVSDNHYIVDRLFAAAELRLGENPQQVVRISRTDGSAGGRGHDADACRSGRHARGRGPSPEPPPRPARSAGPARRATSHRAVQARRHHRRRGRRRAGLAGGAWLALSPKALHLVKTNEQAISDRRTPADAVANLPGDYSKVAATPATMIPPLGPPLPGDLGRPALERQRQLEAGDAQRQAIPSQSPPAMTPEQQAAQAERQRIAAQAHQAREAGRHGSVIGSRRRGGDNALAAPVLGDRHFAQTAATDQPALAKLASWPSTPSATRTTSNANSISWARRRGRAA
jgi:P-type conjugative transfer protein TrbG